jgi:hypothetical protein
MEYLANAPPPICSIGSCFKNKIQDAVKKPVTCICQEEVLNLRDVMEIVLIGNKTIIYYIQSQRLGWLGHVHRMRDERMVKKGI